MSFQATPIPGGFVSVFDTANGKTYFIQAGLWPVGGAGMTQTLAASLAEFVVSSAGDWVKKPAGLRTHEVLQGFIANRAGVAPSRPGIPDGVRNALAALNAAVDLARV
jgi:hypothetical protein